MQRRVYYTTNHQSQPAQTYFCYASHQISECEAFRGYLAVVARDILALEDSLQSSSMRVCVVINGSINSKFFILKKYTVYYTCGMDALDSNTLYVLLRIFFKYKKNDSKNRYLPEICSALNNIAHNETSLHSVAVNISW